MPVPTGSPESQLTFLKTDTYHLLCAVGSFTHFRSENFVQLRHFVLGCIEFTLVAAILNCN